MVITIQRLYRMINTCGNIHLSPLFSALVGSAEAGVSANKRNISSDPLPRSQVLCRRPVQAGGGNHQIPVLPPSQVRHPPGQTPGAQGSVRGSGGARLAV